MGNIISSKVKDDGKVIVEVVLDYEESVQLQGHLSNVHLFTENIANIKMGISQRGKNEATKYFLIPKDLRSGIRMNAKATCQRVNSKTKTIFIYTLDNLG